MNCMLLGEVHTRDTTARAHWANDGLSECHNEDVLWGYAICTSGELEKTTKKKVDDPVLYHLFCMGSLTGQEGGCFRKECLQECALSLW